MKISVIGTGYVGLITGTCFAELGNNVILVDIVRDKVEKINRGIAPIYEEGLDHLLKKNLKSGRIHATTDLEGAIKSTEITFVSVGTPSKKDGSIDLAFMENAARDIGKALRDKRSYHTVVVKSTVVPGTTENVFGKILEKASGKKAGRDFGLAMNPEFLREGKAIEDFMKPERIVIGGVDKKSADAVYGLYMDFSSPVMRTNPKTAEMIKYASNAFLATKVSFINEIGNMCKELGIDTYVVADGMGYDSRIGRKFLGAGIGYGGSCFPKDVKAIMAKAKESGVEQKVLQAADRANMEQPLRMIKILKKSMPVLRGKTIAVLGLAFKPDTDDIREAPSIVVVERLLKEKALVKAYDPKAAENFRNLFRDVEYCTTAAGALENADACLVLTEWEEFRNLEDADFRRMKRKNIIEGRRILDRRKVCGFEGVCW